MPPIILSSSTISEISSMLWPVEPIRELKIIASLQQPSVTTTTTTTTTSSSSSSSSIFLSPKDPNTLIPQNIKLTFEVLVTNKDSGKGAKRFKKLLNILKENHKGMIK